MQFVSEAIESHHLIQHRLTDHYKRNDAWSHLRTFCYILLAPSALPILLKIYHRPTAKRIETSHPTASRHLIGASALESRTNRRTLCRNLSIAVI